MTDCLLNAANLHKNFGNLSVLGDVSVRLNAGEILCVLGASGCGKTTLLNILAGLIEQDSGGIVSSIPRPSPKIGYMTQDSPLFAWRSVLDNVAIGLEFAGRKKPDARKKAAEYLNLVGLSAFSGTYPHELSGGMRQRVALARTLALDPSLLLLDEPLASLDIRGRRSLAAIIKRYIRDRQAAAMIVTHSVEEAVFLADALVILSPSPARIAYTARISDTETEHDEAKGVLFRGRSFDPVLHALLNATPEQEERLSA